MKTPREIYARPRRSRHVAPVGQRPRDGVSLVEMLIAIVMIAVAVGGLLGSSAAVGRQMSGGSAQTIAAAVAQARLDSLTSLACAQLDAGAKSGTTLTRGVQESWNIVDGRNIKTINVTIRVPRRTNPLLYQMVIACRD